MIRLSGLFAYPVKSMRGSALDGAELDALGLVGDRRFVVVDQAGRFLTQRTHPKLTLITATLDSTRLALEAGGAGRVTVFRASDPSAPLRPVVFWKPEGLVAEDCGSTVATWLSDLLEVKCSLVRIGRQFFRPILKPQIARPGDVVSFADSYPVGLVGEESLADLNQRLAARGAAPVSMNRFRPNLVISGGGIFAEDGWSRLRIGEVVFRVAKPCVRCVIPTIDQLTGEGGAEPLRTLAGYRRDAAFPANVNFGQNLIHETKSGTLRVGDVVEPG